MTHMTHHHDFKGLGFSKVGYFKEVRSKIKELEKLNIELAQRHNRLEAIFDSMSDGLTILDRDMNIVFVNQIQKHMFPDISLVGKKCYTAYYRKNRPCRDCPAIRTLETQTTLRGEALVKVGEFSGHYYEWTTSPIKDPFGKVDEIILLMRDITTRKEYEFKLMEADRMAAIGFLAAGIAHEINNPLTSIAGFSEGLLRRLKQTNVLQSDKILKSFQEYLEIINSEAYRCRDIIRNLLEFSRKSTDAYEIIGAEQLIQDTLSLIRQNAKDNHIKIIVKNYLAKGLSRIMGNEAQLKHVFLNLFNKAFKAMSQGGELIIWAKNTGNQIEIYIWGSKERDSGQIPLQLSSETLSNKSPDETDLSLSICYNIIKHHKGEIYFYTDTTDEIGFILRFAAILP